MKSILRIRQIELKVWKTFSPINLKLIANHPHDATAIVWQSWFPASLMYLLVEHWR